MVVIKLKADWARFVEAHHQGLLPLRGENPFVKWDGNSAPEHRAVFDLEFGITCLYMNPYDEVGREFVERCRMVMDRAIREEKYLQRPSGFPMNRGEMLRLKVYSEAILTRNFDHAALRQSADDYMQAITTGPQKWDSQYQAYHLAAVRMSLLADDVERARQLLETRKKFRWHAEEHRILKALGRSGWPGRPEDLAHFDVFFDQVRQPRYSPDVFAEVGLLQLELAALRDKYWISKDGQIDWPRSLLSVSA